MTADKYLSDESFQVKIIAVTTRSPMFLKSYSDVINPDYFESEILRVICMKVLDYYRDYGIPPTKSSLKFMIDEYVRSYRIDSAVANRLVIAIDEVYETDISDEEFVKDQIIEFGQKQELKRGVLSIINLIKSGREGEYEKARDIIEKCLQVGKGVGDLGTCFFDEILEVPTSVRSSIRYINKVPTGITTIDRYTRGGPGGGEVFVFVAPAKRGKTTHLVHVGATGVWFQKPVFHYVMEIDEDDAKLKYAARFTGVSQEDILAGKNMDKYEREAERVASNLNKYLRIKYFLPGTATIGTIRSHLTRTMSRDGVTPGLIIIDYDEQMKIPPGDPYVEFGKLYNQFSALSYEMACPLWTASQGNRGSMQSPLVQVDETADSWKKIMKVDGAITLSQTMEEKTMKSPEVIRWYLEMTRRTKDAVVAKCGIDRDLSYIWELSDRDVISG